MVVGRIRSRPDGRPHRRLRSHRLHGPARRRAPRRRRRAPGAGRPLAGAPRGAGRATSAGSRPPTATSCAPTPCSRSSREGDVLVSTVGPFIKWGEPAVRAAIAGGAALPRLDRRAAVHPPRLRAPRPAPPSAPASPLLTAMGYDFVPGALAGGARARRRAARTRCASTSATTRSGPARRGERRHARARWSAPSLGDCLRLPRRRAAAACGRPSACARSRSRARSAPAVSVGGAEHFGAARGVPAAARGQRLPRLVRPRSRGRCRRARCVGSVATKAARACARRSSSRASGWPTLGGDGPEPGTTPGGLSWVAAQAYDAGGGQVAEVHLSGADGYAFTAEFIAWAARAARGAAASRAPARSGPVEAFGLEELERGCAAAGLSRDSRLSSGPSRTSPAATGPVGSSPPSPVTRSGGLAGPVEELPAQRSSARAGANAAGSRSGQISQRGARGAARVEDAVDRAPRRLVGALHRRQVGVGAHVVRGEEEVRDPRHRVRAGPPTSRRC